MSICIQVIELPELEHLPQREFELPTIGGTIGRSFECDIQLPDQSKKLSRVHAEITLVENGDYLIKDLSSNGLKVNQDLLGHGHSCLLKDGDILEMAGYQMFVSNFDTELIHQPLEAQATHKPFSASFLAHQTIIENTIDYQDIDHHTRQFSMSQDIPVPADTSQSSPQTEKKYSLADINRIIAAFGDKPAIDEAFAQACIQSGAPNTNNHKENP